MNERKRNVTRKMPVVFTVLNVSLYNNKNITSFGSDRACHLLNSPKISPLKETSVGFIEPRVASGSSE